MKPSSTGGTSAKTASHKTVVNEMTRSTVLTISESVPDTEVSETRSAVLGRQELV